MDEDGPGSSTVLPSGWEAVSPTDDASYEWKHDETGVLVSAHEVSHARSLVLVEQYITGAGYTSRVTTHGAEFDSEDVAVDRAHDMMAEISAGDHVVECLSVTEHEEAVDFVCVYRSDVPSDVSLDRLEEVVGDHLEGDAGTITDPELAEQIGDGTITIDVFPRPMTHVRPAGEVDVGDPTTVQAPEIEEGE